MPDGTVDTQTATAPAAPGATGTPATGGSGLAQGTEAGGQPTTPATAPAPAPGAGTTPAETGQQTPQPAEDKNATFFRAFKTEHDTTKARLREVEAENARLKAEGETRQAQQQAQAQQGQQQQQQGDVFAQLESHPAVQAYGAALQKAWDEANASGNIAGYELRKAQLNHWLGGQVPALAPMLGRGTPQATSTPHGPQLSLDQLRQVAREEARGELRDADVTYAKISRAMKPYEAQFGAEFFDQTITVDGIPKERRTAVEDFMVEYKTDDVDAAMFHVDRAAYFAKRDEAKLAEYQNKVKTGQVAGQPAVQVRPMAMPPAAPDRQAAYFERMGIPVGKPSP